MELKGINEIDNFINQIKPYLIMPTNKENETIKFRALWTDYKALSEMVKKQKCGLYIYTLQKIDDKLVLKNGYKYDNRLGYYCSVEYFDIKEDSKI